jgi:hypothetical protein
VHDTRTYHVDSTASHLAEVGALAPQLQVSTRRILVINMTPKKRTRQISTPHLCFRFLCAIGVPLGERVYSPLRIPELRLVDVSSCLVRLSVNYKCCCMLHPWLSSNPSQKVRVQHTDGCSIRTNHETVADRVGARSEKIGARNYDRWRSSPSDDLIE